MLLLLEDLNWFPTPPLHLCLSFASPTRAFMNMEEDSEMEFVEMEEEGEVEEVETQTIEKKVYIPGHSSKRHEELVCDESSYVMLHQAQTGFPCLSFDVIKDDLGEQRETFPLSAYFVAGTQAPRAHTNNVLVVKISNMNRTQKPSNEDDDDDDDEESESEDEDDSKKPKMYHTLISHQGCVNRLRSTVHNNTVLCASWSELGRVNIWNLMPQLQAVDDPLALNHYNTRNTGGTTAPLFSFNGHQAEGYGLDWCSTSTGVLASGDCKRGVHIWNPAEGGVWHIDQRPLVGHTDSVEDLQWSPNERHVLASCSVDKSIRIWDTRCTPNKACKMTVENAHESDVNVISWNKNEPFVVSGGDDGVLHIWDLRCFKAESAVATFKHHTEPVTTLEWHPSDPTVFASGGADNQIALWDLSLERDPESCKDDIEDLPPQLLFIHQGQTDIKELHWHPQLNGVIISTALSGFNIFRTISV